MSFTESGGSKKRSLRGCTGLHFCNQYSCGDLPFTRCELERFLETDERTEDREDIADGILVSRVGMTGDDDYTRHVS